MLLDVKNGFVRTRAIQESVSFCHVARIVSRLVSASYRKQTLSLDLLKVIIMSLAGARMIASVAVTEEIANRNYDYAGHDLLVFVTTV